MASDKVKKAVENLRAALVDDGMDEATAEALTHAAMPNEETLTGNIADLQRSGTEGGGTPLAEPAAEEEEEVEAGSYEDWTKADLQAELDEQGVEYTTSDTKAELIDKLEGG